jgi:hypothetical protein
MTGPKLGNGNSLCGLILDVEKEKAETKQLKVTALNISIRKIVAIL